jgi:predicted nucleotidyltransferase
MCVTRASIPESSLRADMWTLHRICKLTASELPIRGLMSYFLIRAQRQVADIGIVELKGVPASIATGLSKFITSAREALSTDLVSVVVFGSAAEGRLGPTSDVNLVLVLSAFSPERMGQLRDALLAAEAVIKLRIMFLLEDEVSDAADKPAQGVGGEFITMQPLASGTDHGNAAAKRSDQGRHGRAVVRQTVLPEYCH